MLAASLLAGCATAAEPGADASVGPDPADAGVEPDAPPGTPDAGKPDAFTGVPCASGAECAGAIGLGTISGDTGNQKQTAQGYQSSWYRLRVTEDSFSALPTRVAAKLTSPAAADFDVFIYVNVNSDVAEECATTIGTKTSAGKVVTARAEWGESSGGDESRNVSIEVRDLSGTCSVGEIWQLELEGNWQ